MHQPPNPQDTTTPTETYVDADVFESLADPGTGSDGIDWAEKVPETEWEDHEDRLRSVIDAQQEAEVLGTDVLIGSNSRDNTARERFTQRLSR